MRLYQKKYSHTFYSFIFPLIWFYLLPLSVWAKTWTFNLETKGHYRDSENAQFPVAFPFPEEAIPPQQAAIQLRTVDPGKHIDISRLTLIVHGQVLPYVTLHANIDGIDRYDRNPTSSDHEIDLDSLWLRIGKKNTARQNKVEHLQYYFQIGKFAKFERQNDRHLESYGMVSTAFNRFEDSGLELGIEHPSGFYTRFSYTTGNPLFFRDPNALAGDNGTEEIRDSLPVDTVYNSGFPVFYDAEIERFELADKPEIGLGLGFRIQDAKQQHRFNTLFFAYQRQLDTQRHLHGTFYGADLDILDLGEVPGASGIAFPTKGNKKTEYGINIWYYYQRQLSLFTQAVRQNIAGQRRDAWETEIAYTLNNISFNWDEHTIISHITPALRFSVLNPQFTENPLYPAPSVTWQWKKIDAGIRMHILKSMQMTVEYSDNRFIRKGHQESYAELLLSINWRYRFSL